MNSSPAPSAPPKRLDVPSQWHDPLRLIRDEAPSRPGRIVLWSVCCLVLLMIVWSTVGKLDIVVATDGKLVPQTLVKIVQPAEAGTVRAILVDDGDRVKAGQVLIRLDTTLADADAASAASDLASQQMRERRIVAELDDQPMRPQAHDDPRLFAQAQREYAAHRAAFAGSLAQEQGLRQKAMHELQGARDTLEKLERTAPIVDAAARHAEDLARDGYVPAQQAADRRREAIERSKERDAQRAAVDASQAALAAQEQRVAQLRSSYRSDLEKELSDVRARLGELGPNLTRSRYKADLTELRAPQDGIVKDVATTTIGAVVQPGTVLVSLVPQGERLYADVSIHNEDIGFVASGQRAQIKLAAYPFQRYGMLTGKVVKVGADASDAPAPSGQRPTREGNADAVPSYKARIELDSQQLVDPFGRRLVLTPGMQVSAEIQQGRRTVMEYLLSPVRKVLSEAARER
jgi:hemolysin D